MLDDHKAHARIRRQSSQQLGQRLHSTCRGPNSYDGKIRSVRCGFSIFFSKRRGTFIIHGGAFGGIGHV